MAQTAKQQLEGELNGLKTARYSFWIHFGELARFLLPRRYNWLVTQNAMNRGVAINGAILDSTGTIALRSMAAGMMSGCTNPSRQWFKLQIEGYGEDDVNAVNLWLAEVQRRMMRVFQESNFYNAMATMYMDLGCFGTAPVLIFEDFENVIRCENPCAGEFYIGNSDKMIINIFYREFVQTVSQLVAWFGEDKMPSDVKSAYATGGASLTQEYVIVHAIRPAKAGMGIPAKFPFHEFFYLRGSADAGTEEFLSKKGFYEFPAIVPRWDISGNDAYGRSPGMDALGDIKQLQQETKRKAQVIDKMANPPMKAGVEMKNQPASTLPGGVTYITGNKDAVGFSPVYENFNPPIEALFKDIELVQKRIQTIFFNDLFMMFQQMQAEPRSATAIDARREEKTIMLGPVLERLQTEAFDPCIDRTFNIMLRRGLLPPPPPEVSGRPIQVKYVSMLAAAQSAAETAGIERLFQLVGNLAAIHPEALDIPNWDLAIEKYSAKLGNDPDIINTEEVIAGLRQAKAQAARAQQMSELSQGAAKAGKTLSETEVGGGQNALQAIMGGGLQ